MNFSQMDLAKFWSRRRRATTEISRFTAEISLSVSLVALLCGVVPAATLAQDVEQSQQAAAADTTSPQTSGHDIAQSVPARFLEFLDSVSGFSARFIQEVWSDDQRLLEVAEGTVELQRPGLFRWHYESPYEQFIVADGESLWMYDVDIAQVTRSPLAINDPGNPAALLTGDADVLERFDVVDSWELDDELWIELMPKVTTLEYSTVRIAFAAAEGDALPRALEFDDGLDQTTLIRFRDAESNPVLGTGHFEFTPPEGVHVLGGQG